MKSKDIQHECAFVPVFMYVIFKTVPVLKK